MSGQHDNTKSRTQRLIETVSSLNPNHLAIGPGMLRNMVTEARAILEEQAAASAQNGEVRTHSLLDDKFNPEWTVTNFLRMRDLGGNRQSLEQAWSNGRGAMDWRPVRMVDFSAPAMEYSPYTIPAR